MKALRLIKEGSTPQLTLEDVPKPVLQPGHVLVKIRASAINPSDVLNSQGLFPSTTYPRTPGRDFAGVVEDGPSHWKGKEVFGTSGPNFSFTEDGAHAEFCLVKESALVVKPAKLSFVQAASIGIPFTTASLALRRANVTSSDKVMVLGGTGAVGSAAVQLAKSRGCLVVMSVGRGGAADINTLEDPTLKSAKSLTGDAGADVVIDTVADPGLTESAIAVMCHGGRYSFITAPRGESSRVSVDFKHVYRNEISLIGNNSVEHSQEELAQEVSGMTDVFESGQLQPVKESALMLIGLEDAVEAYKAKGNRYVIALK